jgi:hypothetical protein
MEGDEGINKLPPYAVRLTKKQTSLSIPSPLCQEAEIIRKWRGENILVQTPGGKRRVVAVEWTGFAGCGEHEA